VRKLLPFIGLAGAIALVVVFVRCPGLVGGVPLNIQLALDTDSTVKITWSAPLEGTPDKYVVSFKEVGATSFATIGEPTVTQFVHVPTGGATGTYKVAAVFGSETYEGLTMPSTEPKATAATSVSELNAAGNSGYGWTRASGQGGTYSMTQATNAASVDFYITNFAAGYSGTPYSIASPDLGPTDPGGVVPSGSWRVNAFTNPLTSEAGPLPTHSNLVYFNYTDITDPTVVGCYTEDGYYAMVKLSGINTGQGTVQAQSWIQLVKGLRLIKH